MNGTVDDYCEGGEVCWLCEGTNTRSFCDDRGVAHSYKSSIAPSVLPCRYCDTHTLENGYMCSVCYDLYATCSSCGEITYGYSDLRDVCVLCEGEQALCEHGEYYEHWGWSCNECSGLGYITVKKCKHGYTEAHRYCQHYTTTTVTSHKYCSHGYTSQHI